MKTLLFTQNPSFKTLGFMAIIFTLFAFNPLFSQAKTNDTSINERTIKGVISTDDGPLVGANIVLKGTKTGVITNGKGEFTFPVKLKTGDVLLVSYLGYEAQAIEIKDDTTFINLVLTEDMVEMIGALDSNKPYKSKRKN